MKILVTNDDGYLSPFLEILCQKLSSEHSVFLVCPSHEQSGIGQAISIYKSLHYLPIKGKPYPAYRVGGTPSDCVKLSVCHLFPEEDFDLVVSGINPGENAGLSALYSGTVAGAREGATWGIPSLALSVWDNQPHRAHQAAEWLSRQLQVPELTSQPRGVFWNINFPPCEHEQIQGARICAMSQAEFKDKYVEYVTPRGSQEYWLDGYKHPEQFLEGTDDLALSQGYIAITPLNIDQTAHQEITRLESFFGQLTFKKP